MRNGKARHRLKLVRRPVAEIQRARAPHFKRIAARADVLKMQLRATEDEMPHRIRITRAELRRVLDEEIKKRTVTDERDFKRLGNPAAPIALVQ